MPRISAPSVAEHVARQEAAVLRAAARLFADRGFAAVSLGDIAAEVGLARSSLYRYFPDKDHLLLACFRNELEQLLERTRAITGSRAEPTTKLKRWLRLQFDYAADPEHQLFVGLVGELGAVSPEVRGLLLAEHQRLYSTVDDIVAEALAAAGGGGGARAANSHRAAPDPTDVHLLATFVVGLLQAAVSATAQGLPAGRVRSRLVRSALAMVTAG